MTEGGFLLSKDAEKVRNSPKKRESAPFLCYREHIEHITYIYNGIVRMDYGRNVVLSWNEGRNQLKMDKK